MAKRKVAVIFGGRSGEHEVSIVSARSVMQALDRDLWDVLPLGITKAGHWLTRSETCAALEAGATAFTGGVPMLRSAALGELAGCDAAFPLVHGTFGEDGTIQGFLELAALPYAGCGVAASAIGMDKALMKALFREAGIPQARYAVLRAWEAAEDENRAIRYAEEAIGYPCFIKPANGGSSVGVTRVRSREDIAHAFAAAFRYDDKLVIEQAITGQEVECSVLGNEHPEASILGEVVPDREFYDYDSKYSAASTTALFIPARVHPETAETVREMALRMYRVMGCEGYARIDFFVTAGGDVLANEINTIPGFTSISMYPKLWEASGLAYTALLTRIIELGIARHERRSKR
jgi:D-alanine-D-alanine ligase